MIKKLSDNLINSIYSAEKRDSYIVFLAQDGHEVCRVKDDNKDDSLPYKLNLTDSGRINLKDSSGTVLSYIQQLSATEQTAIRRLIGTTHLIHLECYPLKYDDGWKDKYSASSLYGYGGVVLNGGFVPSLRAPLSGTTAIGLRLSNTPYVKLPLNKSYVVKLTTMAAVASNRSVGEANIPFVSPSLKTYLFDVYKTADSQTLDFQITDLGETERGWSVMGLMIEVYGEPLSSVS